MIQKRIKINGEMLQGGSQDVGQSSFAKGTDLLGYSFQGNSILSLVSGEDSPDFLGLSDWAAGSSS